MRELRHQITLADGFLLTVVDRRKKEGLPWEPSLPEVVLTLERSGIEIETRVTDLAWRDIKDRGYILETMLHKHTRATYERSRERFNTLLKRMEGLE